MASTAIPKHEIDTCHNRDDIPEDMTYRSCIGCCESWRLSFIDNEPQSFLCSGCAVRFKKGDKTYKTKCLVYKTEDGTMVCDDCLCNQVKGRRVCNLCYFDKPGRKVKEPNDANEESPPD